MNEPLEAQLHAGPAADRHLEALLDVVRVEASTQGLVDVVFASTDSPVGELTIAATDDGIVALSWDTEVLLETIADKISPRVLEERAGLEVARRQLDEYFDGKRQNFALPIDWTLTKGFRLDVLHELVRVPYGTVVTYRDLAERVHNPNATRAVGSTMAHNPIPLIVPCHRVLQSGGGLGNYSGGRGPETKRWLLHHEGVEI